MKKLIEFIERIKDEKREIHKNQIEVYEKAHESDNFWNGPNLKIEDKEDIFLYISEDKKELFISYNDFDPRRVYSYVIYFNHYLHVAHYTNGGVQLIGFYDNEYKKVNEIPIGEFRITGCSTDCNFEAMRKPAFNFILKHEDGNEHRSIRGNAFDQTSCRKALESIWDLDKFYKDFTKRIQRSPE